MLRVVMLRVVTLRVIILRVAFIIVIPNVIMFNVVLLRVMAPPCSEDRTTISNTYQPNGNYSGACFINSVTE
jgi:hypothetical protein